MGMCKWFLKDATKIQNLTRKKIVGAKTLKPKVRNYSYLLSHSPPYVQVIFQGFVEIKNGRHESTSIFWWALKLKKLVW